MNAGEFFISIGVTGADKTISSLEKVDKLLTDIKKKSKISINVDTQGASKHFQELERQFKRTEKVFDDFRKKFQIKKSDYIPMQAQKAAARENAKRERLALAEQRRKEREAQKEANKRAKQAEETSKSIFGGSISDKIFKSIELLGSGLKNIINLALRAKTALFGLGIGIGYSVGKSIHEGTNLENLRGIFDTEQLQRFQYVAREHGVSPEEITQAFYQIKRSLQEMMVTGQNIEGFQRIMQKTGIIDIEQSVPHFIRHPEEFIKVLQTYLAREKFSAEGDPLLGHRIAENFLPTSIANLAYQNAFNESALGRAKPKTQEDLKVQSELNKRLQQATENWKRFNDNLIIKFGGDFLTVIENFLPKLEEFIEAFIKFTVDFKVFETLASSLKGLSELIEFLSDILYKIYVNLFGTKNEKENLRKQQEFDRKMTLRDLDLKNEQFFRKPTKDFLKGILDTIGNGVHTPYEPIDPDDPYDLKSMFPKAPMSYLKNNQNTQSAVFHQTFNFSGKDNPQEIAFEIRKVIEDSFLTYNSNVRVA